MALNTGGKDTALRFSIGYSFYHSCSGTITEDHTVTVININNAAECFGTDD